MYDKIIEIIVYILEQIKNSKHFTDIDLDELSEKGYTSSEINTAVAWVYSKMNDVENVYSSEAKESLSKRFFNEFEKKLLSPEAEGYLIQLQELGIINSRSYETIFDKIMYSGYGKVDTKEIKAIVSSILFESESSSETLNRLILNNNDTIH